MMKKDNTIIIKLTTSLVKKIFNLFILSFKINIKKNIINYKKRPI